MLFMQPGIKARLPVKRFEMIRKIEMERFSLTTSKRFDEVISSVNAAIGHRFLAPYGNRDALEVARNLDKKIEDLLRQAAA
jgi:hypothetical protein